MSGIAFFSGKEQVELVLGRRDRRGQLNAHRSQSWSANRDEQRLGRFMSAVQVFSASLDEVGSGKGAQVAEAGHPVRVATFGSLVWRKPRVRLPLCHGEIVTPNGVPNADLVEVMFATNRVEAEMVQGLLRSEGVPSMLQATGVNGPQLGVGLLPQGPQRVMVRAEHADVARRLLAETGIGEDSDVDELANAAYLDEAKGRGPRSYGVIGAYARIWFWSLAALAIAFGVFLLARIT